MNRVDLLRHILFLLEEKIIFDIRPIMPLIENRRNSSLFDWFLVLTRNNQLRLAMAGLCVHLEAHLRALVKKNVPEGSWPLKNKGNICQYNNLLKKQRMYVEKKNGVRIEKIPNLANRISKVGKIRNSVVHGHPLPKDLTKAILKGHIYLVKEFFDKYPVYSYVRANFISGRGEIRASLEVIKP